MKLRGLLAAVVMVAGSSKILAHDFWLEPSTFRPAVGAIVATRVFVGQDFRGDPFPRNDDHIVRFVLASPSGEGRMIGQSGAEPAGLVRVPSSGFQLIGYESNPSSVELPPEKVQRYVADEGLAPFFTGDTTQPIVDHFSRCAKSLIVAGDPGAHPTGFDRRFGCALELIPEANPTMPDKSGLPVRLLRDGKPLAGAQVTAMRRDQPETKIKARTDAHGIARIALTGSGVWLLKSVWVRPVPNTSHEWESQWASLTFEVP